jgi:hypothetical protein
MAAVGLGVGAGLWWPNGRSGSREVVFEPSSRVVEPAALCPWREPEADLGRFFPGATGWQAETRILSGQRLELRRLLGRALDVDENSLKVYRVLQGDRRLGAILTRRVKGEHGGIEIVLALDGDSRVSGLRLQRLREPEAIAHVLLDPAWLTAFSGKNAESDWRLGGAVPEVPSETRLSAERIVEGVRSLLILYGVAERQPARHHHS